MSSTSLQQTARRELYELSSVWAGVFGGGAVGYHVAMTGGSSDPALRVFLGTVAVVFVLIRSWLSKRGVSDVGP